MGAGARRRTAMGVLSCIAVAGCSDAGSVSVKESGPTRSGSAASDTPSRAPSAVLKPPRDVSAAEDSPVEDPYYPDTSNPEVDALHYGLDLDWDGKTLRGTATVTLRASTDTSTLTLDLIPQLAVQRATLDGKKVQTSRTDMHLVVKSGALKKGSKHTLSVRYAGTPKRVAASSGRSDSTEGVGWTTNSDGSIHTFQEPWGAYTWYPVNDHPSDEAFYDAKITTRSPLRGVFNGKRVAEQRDASKTTSQWHLDQPAASYVVTIAIDEYRPVKDRMSDGTVMTYWVRPEDDVSLANLRIWGRRAHSWLVKHLGPYPFSSAGVVLVGGDSAMETQTLITMSGAVARSPRQLGEPVLAHEQAHQWFGDDVSPKDWTHLWLNEGWAMYWQGRFEEEFGTGKPWQSYAARDAISRRSAGPPGRYDKAHFGENNVYLGPALMIREMRIKVGGSTFDRLVKQWVKDKSGQHVDRAAFTRWWSKQSGADLKPLIDRWLDSPETPPIS